MRSLNRTLIRLLTAVLLLITAPRLPAPIQEIPESTPTPKSQQPKSSNKTSVRRPATLADAQELRVVVSDGARSALQYLKNYTQTYEHMPFAGKSDVQADEIMERLQQVLSSRFRHVSIATDSSTARTGQSGLVMIFDLHAHVAGFSFQKTTVSVSGTFKDDNGRVLQTVTATGERTMPYPAFTTRFHEAVAAAFADFSQKLSGGSPANTAARR